MFWNKIHRYWTAWADKIYYFAPHGTLPKQRLPFVHWLLVQLCITHRTMLKGNTYITGTLHADQKRNPSQVVGKKVQKGEWFSCPLVTFLSLSGKIKVMLVSSAMLMCQQWWIQSTDRHAKSKRNVLIFCCIAISEDHLAPKY